MNTIPALVLEEIAIDSRSSTERMEFLEEALNLHKASLALAKRAFGENNVQTAKHYGNLGRLYQTMHLWEVSNTSSLVVKITVDVPPRKSLSSLNVQMIAYTKGQKSLVYTRKEKQ